MSRSLAPALALSLGLGALACADAAPPAAPLERMTALASTHHPIDPADLARLDDADLRALHALARDGERPLWLRLRALGIASAHPTAETRELWRELQKAPEGELRVQAAWAAGLSQKGAERLSFAAALLQEEDEKLREVAAHLLAAVEAESRPRAIAIARARVAGEKSEAVRAVLARKLLAGGLLEGSKR